MTWDKTDLLQTIVVGLVVGLAVRFLYHFWTLRRAFAFTWHLAKDQKLPIIIPIGGFYRNLSGFDDRFRRSLQHTYGIWTVDPMVVTADPGIIEQVLKSPSCSEKSKHLIGLLHEITDCGLVAVPMKNWMHKRRMIAPIFRQRELKNLFPIFNKAQNFAIRQCSILVDNQTVPLYDVIRLIVQRTALETIMGKQVMDEKQIDGTLIQSLKLLTEFQPIYHSLSMLNLHGLIKLYGKFHDLFNSFTNITTQLAKDKLKEMEIEQSEQQKTSETTINNNHEQNFSDSAYPQNSPQTFIAHAIENYQNGKWPWQSVISESKTLLVGALETTPRAIFNALLFLAMHPEFQKRLYEEILQVFPNKDFVIEYEHMEQLPYLHRVMQEVLRITPPIAGAVRNVEHDTHLTNGLVLPQGLQVLISIFHLHRRHDIWGPNAHKFDPDHFLPENLNDKHPYAYMPFLKGPRNCVGGRYAQFVIKIMLCSLIRNFYFTTDCKYEDLRFGNDVSLLLLNKPTIRVQHR